MVQRPRRPSSRGPADTPAKDFWSVIVYSMATKGFVKGVDRVGLSSQVLDKMKKNDDGSVIRFFSFFSLVFMASIAAAQQPGSEDAASVKDWVYLRNSQMRVGFLRSHGGALAYLSAGNSDVNVLNHYDHGRLVQQSYYGDADGSRWGDKPWRYNPVQGGDYKGNAARLVEFSSTHTRTPRHIGDVHR